MGCVQADEEYFVVKWSVDTETGAPLLLLAGKRALLHVINCATGTLEVVSKRLAAISGCSSKRLFQ